MTTPRTHLFVSTPMYGVMFTVFYTQSIMTLQKVLASRDIDCTFSFMFNESLITRARNGLTHEFLKTDCTHLMFIDADIRFFAEHLVQMIEADVSIICGIYPKKEVNWDTVKAAMDRGVANDQLKHHTGSFVVNLVNYDGEVTVPMNQPVEIWNGGTGFMLIKRQVFIDLEDRVPTYTNNVVDLANPNNAGMISEYFATSIDPETNVLLSEDYHFCRLARMNGIKVYAAPWATLGHMGSYLFEGYLLQTP